MQLKMQFTFRLRELNWQSLESARVAFDYFSFRFVLIYKENEKGFSGNRDGIDFIDVNLDSISN